jgi:pimeloyl-ACP methyl ester carboxylesterase
MKTPTLVMAGATDKTTPPERVRELYTDLGSTGKIFVDIACSSHYAMWEKNHNYLFRASFEWLTAGSVNGTKEGEVRLGY